MIAMFRRLLREQKGAVIVEFALVVPFLFLIVFGIIDFSRAYAQLNNINSSLREGARFGAAQIAPDVTQIKAEITRFSSAWGNPINTSLVTVNVGPPDIVVSVTNYPITLPTLGGFLRIAGRQITVSRTVSFRWERSCPIGGCP
jgi:Flp pilus assembly protein TadG